jgi:hypothetical protein
MINPGTFFKKKKIIIILFTVYDVQMQMRTPFGNTKVVRIQIRDEKTFTINILHMHKIVSIDPFLYNI